MTFSDVLHFYGLLYHLQEPARLIAAMGALCTDFAVIETCLSVDSGPGILFVGESPDHTQSLIRRV